MGFVSKSPNLINKATVIINQYVDPTYGWIAAFTNNDTSDIIEIEPNTNYIKNVNGQVAFYKADRTFISRINEVSLERMFR